MSEKLARDAMMRMSMTAVALAVNAVPTFASDMQHMAAADPEQQQKAFMEQRRADLCAAYGFESRAQNKPFAFADGLAIIPISGTLINRFGGAYSWVTGYNFIRQQTALALADDDVVGIVYDCNSFGGEVAGCFETADVISAAGKEKPTLAVVDSNCYSACYALASAANKIVAIPSGGVGSVGVLRIHVDMSKMMEGMGMKITMVHAGAHKVDENPYEELPEDVKKNMQASVDKSYGRFVGTVARNRGMEEKAVRATEARIFSADDALSIGFIDALATPQEAVQAFFNELSGSGQQEKDNAMSGQEATKPGAQENSGTTAAAPAQPAAPLQAAAPAGNASGERARIKGITGCEAAKGRENLANHLAFDTDLTAEQASAILGAAALDNASATAPAVAKKPEEQKPVEKGNAFANAMDNTPNPKVGADGASGGNGGEENRAGRLMAAHTAATGHAYRK